MRKRFLFIILALIVVNTSQAQTKSTKIGYIDMEYILQNVPDYKEAQTQLEQRAEKWKQEIETKKLAINKLKEALKAEKALLTNELIDERETEIKFLETETLDYQQSRFGVNGDLMRQKSALAKPIQDQVFTAVQDIAEAKKYDFIFDRSSDLTMLFAAKRYDVSDQVLRIITRTDKREQLTKKQLAIEEAKENKESAIDENPAAAERQKILDERKAARDKILEDRKLAQEEKVRAYEENKKALRAAREAKKNGTVSETVKTDGAPVTTTPTTEAAKTTVTEETKAKQAEERQKLAEERQKLYDERKKALEEKRKKILEEREAAKKAREQKAKEEKDKQTNTTNN
jgi:Skp family chaperone for outer membrane proteins